MFVLVYSAASFLLCTVLSSLSWSTQLLRFFVALVYLVFSASFTRSFAATSFKLIPLPIFLVYDCFNGSSFTIPAINSFIWASFLFIFLFSPFSWSLVKFFTRSIPGLFWTYFRSFSQSNITIFTTIKCEEMSIQYPVQGFEPTTSPPITTRPGFPSRKFFLFDSFFPFFCVCYSFCCRIVKNKL